MTADDVLVWLYRARADDPRAGKLTDVTTAEEFMGHVATLEEEGCVQTSDEGVALTPDGIRRAEELGAQR